MRQALIIYLGMGKRDHLQMRRRLNLLRGLRRKGPRLIVQVRRRGFVWRRGHE
jgi:hypothetical protein